MDNINGEIIIYQTDDGLTKIDVNMIDENVWLTIDQMAELFQKARSTINEHILHIYEEHELLQEDTMRKIGIYDFSTKPTNYYNLDVIISVGYRVKSIRGTQFRIWATKVLKEYMIKGFALDDERIKKLGGGGYFKELLDRIRDIRATEKVFYRQVLEIYATSIDYNPKAEVIYHRADAEKDFMGLMTFSGEQPTLKEAKVVKNYLNEKELRAMRQIVSGYLDFAERQAEREIPMTMDDWPKHLDGILTSTGEDLLVGNGTVSHIQAIEKAETEYKKYKKKTLSVVEHDYLEAIKQLEKEAKK